MSNRTFSFWMLAVLAACLSLQAWAGAQDASQEATPSDTGKLTSYINLDAKDTATKLDVLTQTLYEQEQRTIALQFQLQYAGRVNISRVAFPIDDNSLCPGYVFTPPKLQPGKHYPAIVLIHGGFHERFNIEWFRFIDEAISKGYVVIFPEYRGSRGYGANHYQNDYGKTDVADVLFATRYFAAKEFVDPARIGIFGMSRGGLVALLAIEKEPKTFPVAIDVVGLTDFVAYMAYKPEYRRNEVAQEEAFGGKSPNKNLAAYMAASPINNVQAIQTPLLVLATTGDKIAPIELHSGRLIDVLTARHKVFESHIYDNAPGGHTFIYGDTWQQRDAYARIFTFLGRYLHP